MTDDNDSRGQSKAHYVGMGVAFGSAFGTALGITIGAVLSSSRGKGDDV